MFTRIATLPRKFKILLMLLCDIILLPLAFWSSIALRMGTWQPPVWHYWWLFALIPLMTVPIFVKFGLYRAVIRYLDDKIIYTVFYGVTASVLVLVSVVAMSRVGGLPRSSIVIFWIMAVAYIASSRFVARGLMRSLENFDDHREPVAIYGAGRAGLQTLLALHSGREYKPVAIFDDNKDLHGTSLAGIRVYDSKDAEAVLGQKKCRQLLLAIPSASRSRRRVIIESFEGKNIILKTIPGMGELIDGKIRIEDIREVGVEDLLGRDPVPPFPDLIQQCIKDCVVLITGAGGSIGSELCRQVALNFPKKLILFERSEYALYRIEQELAKNYPRLEVEAVLGDVLNRAGLEQVMIMQKVQTVYHAAAYKHVPLVEYNPLEGIKNNSLGTYYTALAATRAGVANFVLISTDKAVRPTNVMGATKRLAELILQYLSSKQNKTRFTMVRFGNVLGSSGSVVPLFKDQIRHGGPITVTHPEVTRYFMTIPEAAQLVLQAGSMGQGGDVFVLDMGEPVRITDLAKKMVELSGLEIRDPKTGRGDISIEYVGLRPGEKLFEELLIGNEIKRTLHPRILSASEKILPPEILERGLQKIEEICKTGMETEVRPLLRHLVGEYVPEQDGNNDKYPIV